jgi:beta-glucosidase
VRIEPGASEQVRIVVDPEATNHPLSVWSYCERSFTIASGDYTVYVGTSSEDTPFTQTFSVA